MTARCRLNRCLLDCLAFELCDVCERNMGGEMLGDCKYRHDVKRNQRAPFSKIVQPIVSSRGTLHKINTFISSNKQKRKSHRSKKFQTIMYPVANNTRT